MKNPSIDNDLYGFKEILYEYNPQGRYLGVCALDPESLVEATIIAPSSANLQGLKRMAARKLRIAVDKKNGKHTPIMGATNKPAYGKREDNSGWNL